MTDDRLATERPLVYWLARYPPGWISRHMAHEADPLALAAEIQAQSAAFLRWLELPDAEHWDTYALQSLSAALFNRYRVHLRAGRKQATPTEVGLLQLHWPWGSDPIHGCLARLQGLLSAPFAVFKVLRVAAREEDYPTRQELQAAKAALKAVLPQLDELFYQLLDALNAYQSARCGVFDLVLQQPRSATPSRELVAPPPNDRFMDRISTPDEYTGS